MAEFLTSDGVRLVYTDIGPRAGVPVVLCHGIAAAGEQLASDAVYFADRGHRVLVPDLRGHGRSGKPVTLTPQTFAIARLAQDLVEMLEHAGVGPVHWVGNSLGGIVALQLLAAHESRFRTLTTFGTAYRLDLPGWIAGTIPLGYKALGAGWIGALAALATTRNAAARPVIEQLVRGFDPEVGRVLAGNLAAYNLIGNATAARLPILLLRCGRDRLLNLALGPTLSAMAERDNFRMAELPAGGHCANLDATAAFRAVLDAFWAANADFGGSAAPVETR